MAIKNNSLVVTYRDVEESDIVQENKIDSSDDIADNSNIKPGRRTIFSFLNQKFSTFQKTAALFFVVALCVGFHFRKSILKKGVTV